MLADIAEKIDRVQALADELLANTKELAALDERIRKGAPVSSVQKLMELHEELLKDNPYCYFELAYTKQAEWMAWICSNSREQDPEREVLARGQGSTPEIAAEIALAYAANHARR